MPGHHRCYILNVACCLNIPNKLLHYFGAQINCFTKNLAPTVVINCGNLRKFSKEPQGYQVQAQTKGDPAKLTPCIKLPVSTSSTCQTITAGNTRWNKQYSGPEVTTLDPMVNVLPAAGTPEVIQTEEETFEIENKYFTDAAPPTDIWEFSMSLLGKGLTPDNVSCKRLLQQGIVLNNRIKDAWKTKKKAVALTYTNTNGLPVTAKIRVIDPNSNIVNAQMDNPE